MAILNLSLDGTFQLRSRGSGWATVVAGDGDVFNGDSGGARVDYINNLDGGTNFTLDRIHFRFDVGGDVPSTATITNVKLILTTDSAAQNITDSDYMKSHIVKATSTTLDNTGTAATTWDAIDTSVLHGDFVTVATTDDADNEFDFGSGDLFDYVVAQHAAGSKAAFWHLSKLEFDGTAPTGQNANQFNWSTDSNPPILKVTFTLPPVFNTKLKISSGTTKVLGGNLTIK